MWVLYNAYIEPDEILNITADNLKQFEVLGNDEATVRNQLLTIAWNRGDYDILTECDGDVNHPRYQKFIHARGRANTNIFWEDDGVRITIFV